jgi:hypothetical protein
MALGAWLLALVAMPAGPAQEEDLDARVRRAIDAGVEYLLREQERDGSWCGGHQSGITALALYTLLKSGVQPYEVPVLDAVAEVYAMAPSRTYDTALAILALGAHDARANLPRITELSDALLDWQHGDWGYPSGADLSNTQYGALGLWGARRAGVKIPHAVWRSLERSLSAYRCADGGYAYSGNSGASGSMTAAGVGTLAICEDGLGAAGMLGEDDHEDMQRRIREGIDWLGANFSVTTNPGAGGWLYYYLYGLERVGALTGERSFSAHDWYREGAEYLVGEQSTDGGWSENGGWKGGARGGTISSSDVVQSCFALLFLRRATRPVSVVEYARPAQRFAILEDDAPVRLVATGQDPITLWTDGFSPDTVAALEWPKEKGRGLHIGQVIYFDGQFPIEEVSGDAAKPAGIERFAVQHRFHSTGPHKIWAEIHVLAPPTEDAEGMHEHPRILRSGELVVQVDALVPEWLRELASDPAKNLVPGSRVRVKASSVWKLGERDGEVDYAPERAVDGRLGTSWLADPTDRTPVLDLRFEHAPRARTIVLTHAMSRPCSPAAFARALEVEVTVNGKKTSPLQMPYDEMHKARLVLPEPTAVHELSIRILWSVPGETCAAVGLAEVELQAD